ncbi:MAG: type II secretion system minor pseudopilin GspJ [Betaproteobacteria bacterium]|nr:type II secretion system minor pseudopilin GspJ [Betaproteobacteria bacterium]
MTQRGFTLIELLVAIVILALVSVMAYRGLNAVIEARKHVEAESRKWRDLSLFFARLEDDATHPAHRPIRDKDGLLQPEWIGKTSFIAQDDANLALTRMGAGEQGPQRVGYRLNQGVIEVLIWPSLDQAPFEKPTTYPLLGGVKEFKLRYLTINHQWVETWPLPGQVGGLPKALEVTVGLDSGERVKRIFALP